VVAQQRWEPWGSYLCDGGVAALVQQRSLAVADLEGRRVDSILFERDRYTVELGTPHLPRHHRSHVII
jgi:hypothetical protein